MNKQEIMTNLEQDIMYRKDTVVRELNNAIERLMKYKEESENLNNATDVMNFSRNLANTTYDINQQLTKSFESIDHIRIGLYYINCLEEK